MADDDGNGYFDRLAGMRSEPHAGPSGGAVRGALSRSGRETTVLRIATLLLGVGLLFGLTLVGGATWRAWDGWRHRDRPALTVGDVRSTRDYRDAHARAALLAGGDRLVEATDGGVQECRLGGGLPGLWRTLTALTPGGPAENDLVGLAGDEHSVAYTGLHGSLSSSDPELAEWGVLYGGRSFQPALPLHGLEITALATDPGRTAFFVGTPRGLGVYDLLTRQWVPAPTWPKVSRIRALACAGELLFAGTDCGLQVFRLSRTYRGLALAEDPAWRLPRADEPVHAITLFRRAERAVVWCAAGQGRLYESLPERPGWRLLVGDGQGGDVGRSGPVAPISACAGSEPWLLLGHALADLRRYDPVARRLVVDTAGLPPAKEVVALHELAASPTGVAHLLLERVAKGDPAPPSPRVVYRRAPGRWAEVGEAAHGRLVMIGERPAILARDGRLLPVGTVTGALPEGGLFAPMSRSGPFRAVEATDSYLVATGPPDADGRLAGRLYQAASRGWTSFSVAAPPRPIQLRASAGGAEPVALVADDGQAGFLSGLADSPQYEPVFGRSELEGGPWSVISAASDASGTLLALRRGDSAEAVVAYYRAGDHSLDVLGHQPAAGLRVRANEAGRFVLTGGGEVLRVTGDGLAAEGLAGGAVRQAVAALWGLACLTRDGGVTVLLGGDAQRDLLRPLRPPAAWRRLTVDSRGCLWAEADGRLWCYAPGSGNWAALDGRDVQAVAVVPAAADGGAPAELQSDAGRHDHVYVATDNGLRAVPDGADLETEMAVPCSAEGTPAVADVQADAGRLWAFTRTGDGAALTWRPLGEAVWQTAWQASGRAGLGAAWASAVWAEFVGRELWLVTSEGEWWTVDLDRRQWLRRGAVYGAEGVARVAQGLLVVDRHGLPQWLGEAGQGAQIAGVQVGAARLEPYRAQRRFAAETGLAMLPYVLPAGLLLLGLMVGMMDREELPLRFRLRETWRQGRWPAALVMAAMVLPWPVMHFVATRALARYESFQAQTAPVGDVRAAGRRVVLRSGDRYLRYRATLDKRRQGTPPTLLLTPDRAVSRAAWAAMLTARYPVTSPGEPVWEVAREGPGLRLALRLPGGAVRCAVGDGGLDIDAAEAVLATGDDVFLATPPGIVRLRLDGDVLRLAGLSPWNERPQGRFRRLREQVYWLPAGGTARRWDPATGQWPSAPSPYPVTVEDRGYRWRDDGLTIALLAPAWSPGGRRFARDTADALRLDPSGGLHVHTGSGWRKVEADQLLAPEPEPEPRAASPRSAWQLSDAWTCHLEIDPGPDARPDRVSLVYREGAADAWRPAEPFNARGRLPDEDVRCVLPQSHAVWFGTARGLVRRGADGTHTRHLAGHEVVALEERDGMACCWTDEGRYRLSAVGCERQAGVSLARPGERRVRLDVGTGLHVEAVQRGSGSGAVQLGDPSDPATAFDPADGRFRIDSVRDVLTAGGRCWLATAGGVQVFVADGTANLTLALPAPAVTLRTGAAGALYALLDSGITRRLGDRGRPAGDPFHTATVTGWTRHLELACTYRPGGDALALAAAGQPVTWRDGKLSADWVEQAAPAGPLRWEGTEPAVVACLEWDRWQPQRAVPWPPGGQGRLAGDADQLVCLNDRGTWALGESGWRVASTRAFDAPSPTFDVDHWSIPDLPPPLHITCRSARGEQLDRLDDEGRFPMDEVRGAAPWAGLVWVVHDWGVTAWEPGAQPRRRHEMPFLDRGILPGAGRLGLGVAEGALWLKVTYRGGREALLELTRSQLDHAQPRKLAFRTVSTGARVESPWERRGEQHCSEPRQLAWRPGATVVTLSEPGRPPQRVELSDRVVYACRHGGWFWVVTRQGLHRLR